MQLINPGPNFYYKYQPINDKTLKNLEEDQLWMSRVHSFNDPFEFKYKVVNTSGNQSKYDAFLHEMNNVGILCLSTHNSLILNNELDDSNLHPENMLMWAHYTSNHYGFCLGLRKMAVLYQVHYLNDFPIIDFDDTDFDPKIQAFFAIHRKQLCWQYENEFRALNYDIFDSGLSCKDTYELERIYFGLRTEEKEINLVKNILEGRDVKFYKAEIDDSKYLINFKEI